MENGNPKKASKKKQKESAAEKPAGKGRGGARPGAGRKSGSGAFGEATQPIRVPLALVAGVERALSDYKERVARAKEAGAGVAPLSKEEIGGDSALVAQGGPSGKPVSIGALLAQNPESSFAWTADRDIPALGIFVGDALIIDRAAKAGRGSILAQWGEAGIELSRAAGEGEAAWGVAVGLARKL